MNGEAAPKKRAPQFALGTFLLAIGVIATNLGWYHSHQQIRQLEAALPSMRFLARELQVVDESKVAVISCNPQHAYDYSFDVFVPAIGGNGGQLCLAMEGIALHTFDEGVLEFPDEGQCVAITPGRHRIKVVHDRLKPPTSPPSWLIEVLLDGEVVISAIRPPKWHTSFGWSGSPVYQETKVFEATSALIYSHRFKQVDGNGKEIRDTETPHTGVLVWITG